MSVAFLIAPSVLAYLVLAHDGYEGLTRIDRQGFGMPCCGGIDCGPTEARRLADGSWQAMITDETGSSQWLNVPPDRVLPAQVNPKVGPSVCYRDQQILCFMPGREF